MKLIVGNRWTRSIEKIPENVIQKVFTCKSIKISYFDEERKIRTQYPVRKEINWNFYDYGLNRFPSGFLSSVVTEYSSLYNDEVIIEYENIPPIKKYNFDKEFEAYLHKKIIDNEKFELRNFQIEAKEAVKKYCSGVICIGTGGGKTVFYGLCIKELGLKTLYITIDNTSRGQAFKDFCDMFGDKNVGRIDWEDYKDYPIIISNIQNLWAKYKNNAYEFTKYLDTIDFLIINEGHHINESKIGSKYQLEQAGNTWYQIVMKIPAFYVIMGTATVPDKNSLSDKLITGAIGDVIFEKSTEDLIKEGYAVSVEVHVYTIEFNNNEHIKAMVAYQNLANSDKINRLIAKVAYYYASQNLRVLIFCEWIKNQVEPLSYLLNGLCERLDGSVNKEDRQNIIKDFENNKFSVLIGTIFNEDINIPSVDVGIILGKKKNKKSVKQRTGRVTRLFVGKNKGIVVLFYIQDRKQRRVKDKNGISRIKLIDGLLAEHSKEAIKILKSEGHKIIYKNIEDIDKEVKIEIES